MYLIGREWIPRTALHSSTGTVSCSICLNVQINRYHLKFLFLYYIRCSMLKRSKPDFHFHSDLPTMQNVMFFIGIFLQFLSVIQGSWQLRVVHLSLELCNSSQTEDESCTYHNFSSAQCNIWQFCLFLCINKNRNTNLYVFLNCEDFVKRLFFLRKEMVLELRFFISTHCLHF